MELNEAIYYILRKSKTVWKKGHPLLSAIASHSYSRLKDDPEMYSILENNILASLNLDILPQLVGPIGILHPHRAIF